MAQTFLDGPSVGRDAWSGTVRAMAVVPGRPDTAGVIDIAEPPMDDGPLVVATRMIGICGTDRDIVEGEHGSPPPGEDHLVLGHESVGEVLDAPAGAGLAPGDLVVGIVRRPDPVPCPACAAGEWDMCRNGRFVERGIKGRHGYGSERYRIHPEFAVRVDPALGMLGVLLEPTSVVAKAWEQIERIGSRTVFAPRVALVTGAGPIGLLAALLARQRGLETHVVDLVTEGPKPDLVAALGATYHSEPVGEIGIRPDVAVECTGVGEVAVDVIRAAGPAGVVALTGIRDGDAAHRTDLDAINRELVLGNKAVFGTVNAARRHYEQGERALCRANPSWLERLISRRLPLDRWSDGLVPEDEDIKVVVELPSSSGAG